MIDIETKNNLSGLPETWDDSDLKLSQNAGEYRPKKRVSFAFKFFITSLILFLIAGGLVVFSILKKGASFSENRIVITSTGPGSITSGENGQIEITISNNNNSPVTEAYIMATYDSGEDAKGGKNMVNTQVEIGEVLANTTITKTFDFSIFGAEGVVKEIKPVFYYKLPSAREEFGGAIFTKESNPVSVVLKSSPVSINVKSLKEIHQGYTATFTISVRNNTGNEIKNLIVSARNPNNFTYASSSVEPFSNSPSWKIASLSANSQKEIIMTGVISGNIGDAPTFTFYTGLKKEDANNINGATNTLSNFDNYSLDIDNVYSKVEKTINIAGQYLDMYLSSEPYASDNTVTAGQVITLELTYRNNTAFPIDNLVLQAKLIGDEIDMTNSAVQDGLINYQDKSFMWNKDTAPELSRVPAYGSGKLRLNVRVNSKAPLGSVIRLVAFGQGDRNSEDNVSNLQDISLDKSWIVSSN